MSQNVIALNRFGYGIAANEQAQLNASALSPANWLISHLKTIKFNQTTTHNTSNQILKDIAALKAQRKLAKQNKQQMQATNPGRYARQRYREMALESLSKSITSVTSINWRLLDFWSNHFSVTANGALMTALSPTLEREAIAPNMLGNFSDLLLSVCQHPAMLIYLNNEKSFGNNSPLVKRWQHTNASKKQQRGINENLAREILELHTLGVDSGYSQQDVIELANGISGWGVANPKRKKEGQGFYFRALGHEPGSRHMLGKQYSQQGIRQGQQMLADLAVHPATIKHVCFKLARHFVADNPAPQLLKEMELAWSRSHGNIKQVITAMLNSPLAWQDEAQKFKTPREFVIASYRLLLPQFADSNTLIKRLLFSLKQLGQEPFKAGSPKGYSDLADDWQGANSLTTKADWAYLLAGASQVKATDLLNDSLDPIFSQLSKQSVLRAESNQQALALLLMSPELLRR